MSAPATVRPQVGLMLSCGEPPTTIRNYPRKLDYIRAKPGALGQYSAAAQRFEQVYGDRPRMVDVLFVSDTISDVLDVRPKVYGTSGIKGVGVENLAEAAPGWFGERIRAYDWDLVTFPDDAPGQGEYTVHGRDDKAVSKLGLKVYGTLRVSIPAVTGLMMLAEISTTSIRSMENWHNALHLASRITGGTLVGVPFRLLLRPARGRYWDAKEQKRKTTEFYEWVLESTHTLDELYRIAEERRQAVGAGTAPRLELPPVRHGDLERDAELIAPSPEAAVVAAAEVPRIDLEVFEEQDLERPPESEGVDPFDVLPPSAIDGERLADEQIEFGELAEDEPEREP
jgi:hypothetical protein